MQKRIGEFFVYYTVKIPNVLFLNYLYAFCFNHLYFLCGTAECF